MVDEIQIVERTRTATDPAPGRVRRTRVDRSVASWWWALPALALLVLVHYAAVAAGAVYSFTDARGFNRGNFIGFQNYIDIVSDEKTRVAFVNTIVMAVVFVVVTSLIGLGFALMLNRGLKSRHLLRVLLFMPFVLSPLAVSYIWKFIYDPTGPLNDLLTNLGLDGLTRVWLGDASTAVAAITVVMIWQNIGITMVIYLAGLANIPGELEEAAAVDGAGAGSRFWHVTLPLLRPAVAISTTLLMIQGLRVFDQVIALTNGGPFGASETLSTLVYKFSFVSGQFGYGAALSVLLTILIVVVSIIQNALQRRKED